MRLQPYASSLQPYASSLQPYVHVQVTASLEEFMG